jgi:hypothetical protein
VEANHVRAVKEDSTIRKATAEAGSHREALNPDYRGSTTRLNLISSETSW